MRNAIAYVRVSTTGQGKSGLGLEAQGEAIARFAAQEGFHIVHSFAEIETGKGADALDRRPKLAGWDDHRDGAGREGLSNTARRRHG
jgi:DNA invertase Pin-like site-specific DNA recombinase